MNKAIKRAVRAAYPVPENLARLARLAAHDLYYGPIYEPDDGKPWPGFQGALAAIESWMDKNLPATVWVDTEAEFATSVEPEAFETEDGEWIEPPWEDYYKLEGAELFRAAIQDNELAGYI